VEALLLQIARRVSWIVVDLQGVADPPRYGGALNLNPHVHSILPDGLWVAGNGSAERLRFEPLPPPTTADVEELTVTIARRLMERVAAAWEAEGSDYLDPELAALCEAFFFSRNPRLATRASTLLPGTEGEEGDAGSLRGKPLCACYADPGRTSEGPPTSFSIPSTFSGDWPVLHETSIGMSSSVGLLMAGLR